MIQAVVFIGLAIVAVVELGKRLFPPKGQDRDVRGAFVILGAVLVGVVVALLDTRIGVVDISVAQGIVIGLDAVGIHQVARQVG